MLSTNIICKLKNNLYQQNAAFEADFKVLYKIFFNKEVFYK